jgi:mono/diheme cytochrome c family protein
MKKLLAIMIVGLWGCSDSSIDSKKMALGSKIYSNRCSACHDHGAPNLNELKPKIAQIISTVTKGQGMMPSFKDQLTTEEIEAVAYYIFNKNR